MSNPDTRTERFDGAPPGPWRFEISPIGNDVKLMSLTPMQPYVMGMVRYGMQGAQPTFPSADCMEKAIDLSTPEAGREHHANWHRVIDHPVAALIEAAPTLLAERDALRTEVETLRAALGKIAARECDSWAVGSCYSNGRTEHAEYSADLVCAPCLALRALTPEAEAGVSHD